MPIIIAVLAYSRKGEVELAVEDYTQAIELKPDYAEAYYNRGNRAFLRLGEQRKSQIRLDNCQKHWG